MRTRRSITWPAPVPDAFFNPLYEKLKMYYVTGGMPETLNCGILDAIELEKPLNES